MRNFDPEQLSNMALVCGIAACSFLIACCIVGRKPAAAHHILALQRRVVEALFAGGAISGFLTLVAFSGSVAATGAGLIATVATTVLLVGALTAAQIATARFVGATWS